MPALIPQTTRPDRRVSHYVPKPRFHSNDASQHCHSLMEALSFWIAAALAGGKRHRLSATTSTLIARDSDTIRCDIAAALAAAKEWDGFELAHHLRLREWPADVDLVRLCHQWSCGLMDNIMAVYRNRPSNFRGDR